MRISGDIGPNKVVVVQSDGVQHSGFNVRAGIVHQLVGDRVTGSNASGGAVDAVGLGLASRDNALGSEEDRNRHVVSSGNGTSSLQIGGAGNCAGRECRIATNAVKRSVEQDIIFVDAEHALGGNADVGFREGEAAKSHVAIRSGGNRELVDGWGRSKRSRGRDGRNGRLALADDSGVTRDSNSRLVRTGGVIVDLQGSGRERSSALVLGIIVNKRSARGDADNLEVVSQNLGSVLVDVESHDRSVAGNGAGRAGTFLVNVNLDGHNVITRNREETGIVRAAQEAVRIERARAEQGAVLVEQANRGDRAGSGGRGILNRQTSDVEGFVDRSELQASHRVVGGVGGHKGSGRCVSVKLNLQSTRGNSCDDLGVGIGSHGASGSNRGARLQVEISRGPTGVGRADGVRILVLSRGVGCRVVSQASANKVDEDIVGASTVRQVVGQEDLHSDSLGRAGWNVPGQVGEVHVARRIRRLSNAELSGAIPDGGRGDDVLDRVRSSFGDGSFRRGEGGCISVQGDHTADLELGELHIRRRAGGEVDTQGIHSRALGNSSGTRGRSEADGQTSRANGLVVTSQSRGRDNVRSNDVQVGVEVADIAVQAGANGALQGDAGQSGGGSREDVAGQSQVHGLAGGNFEAVSEGLVEDNISARAFCPGREIVLVGDGHASVDVLNLTVGDVRNVRGNSRGRINLHAQIADFNVVNRGDGELGQNSVVGTNGDVTSGRTIESKGDLTALNGKFIRGRSTKAVRDADAGAVGVTRGVDIVGLVDVELDLVDARAVAGANVANDRENASNTLTKDVRNGKDEGRSGTRDNWVLSNDNATGLNGQVREVRKGSSARVRDDEAADGDVFARASGHLEVGEFDADFTKLRVRRSRTISQSERTTERTGHREGVTGNWEGSTNSRAGNHISGGSEREVVGVTNNGGGIQITNNGNGLGSSNRQIHVVENNLVGGRGNRAAGGQTSVAIVEVDVGPVRGNTSAHAGEGEASDGTRAGDINLQEVNTLGIAGNSSASGVIRGESDVQRATARETLVGVDRRRGSLLIGNDEVGSGRNLRAYSVVGEEGVGDVIDLLVPVRTVERHSGSFGRDPAENATVSDGVNLGVRLNFDHASSWLVSDVTTDGDSGKFSVGDGLNGREIGVPSLVRLVAGEHVALHVGSDVVDSRHRSLDEIAGSRSRSNTRSNREGGGDGPCNGRDDDSHRESALCDAKRHLKCVLHN